MRTAIVVLFIIGLCCSYLLGSISHLQTPPDIKKLMLECKVGAVIAGYHIAEKLPVKYRVSINTSIDEAFVECEEPYKKDSK